MVCFKHKHTVAVALERNSAVSLDEKWRELEKEKDRDKYPARNCSTGKRRPLIAVEHQEENDKKRERDRRIVVVHQYPRI